MEMSIIEAISLGVDVVSIVLAMSTMGKGMLSKKEEYYFKKYFTREIEKQFGRNLENEQKEYLDNFILFFKGRKIFDILSNDFNKTSENGYICRDKFIQRELEEFKNDRLGIGIEEIDLIRDILRYVYDTVDTRVNSLKDEDHIRLYNHMCRIIKANNDKNMELMEKYISELKDSINEIDKRIDRGYSIASHYISLEKEFYGRDKEVSNILEMICSSDKKAVFIQGVGGIGKSTIVKKILEEMDVKDRFNKILFLNFTSGVIPLINDSKSLYIKNFNNEYEDGEDEEKFFRRKLQALKEATDRNTLVIVDNFDMDVCPRMKEFLNGPYSVIFTSRNDHRQRYKNCIDIREIEEFSEIKKIFYEYCKKADKDDRRCEESVRRLIELVKKHTLAVELLAKQINENDVTVEEMIGVLEREGFSNNHNTKYFMDDSDEVRSMKEHILSIFLRANYMFDDNDKYILTNLALIPPSGICQKEFKKLIKRNDINDSVAKLIRHGWIQREFQGQRSMISLHPVINEVVTIYLEVTSERGKGFNLIKGYIEKIKMTNGRSKAEFSTYFEKCIFADKKLKMDLSEAVMELRMNILEGYSSLGSKYAIEYGEELIVKYEKYFNKYPEIKMKLHAAIAFDCFRIMDDEEKARGHLNSALEISRNIMGFEVYRAEVYNAFGDLVYKKNRDESNEWRVKALEALEGVKEEYPIKYSIVLLNIAWYMHYKQEYEEAYSYAKDALRYRVPEGCESIEYWNDGKLKQYCNSYMAKVYSDIGRFYYNLQVTDRFDTSLENLKVALRMYKYIFGEMHKDVARTYEGMGLVYDAQGDSVNALERFKKAEEIFAKNGSKANRGTIKFYMARVLGKMGKTEEALVKASESYNIRKEIFDKDDFVIKEVRKLMSELGGSDGAG